MKTVILYFSQTGHCRRVAQQLGETLNAPAFEVKELKKRTRLTAIISGCPQAKRRFASPIHPLEEDLNAYDKIYIVAPIWAGFPAPAFNSIVALLPTGKEIAVHLCSASGSTAKSAPGTKKLIESKGCILVDYRDSKVPGKGK